MCGCKKGNGVTVATANNNAKVKAKNTQLVYPGVRTGGSKTMAQIARRKMRRATKKK